MTTLLAFAAGLGAGLAWGSHHLLREHRRTVVALERVVDAVVEAPSLGAAREAVLNDVRTWLRGCE